MGPFYFMKISDLSIISIVPFVLGVDNTPSYKGGPKIVELFNAVGFRDDYWILNRKGLFGSRKDFVKNKLLEINGKSQLKEGEFKHEVRQFQKPYDNQQAEQISLMV